VVKVKQQPHTFRTDETETNIMPEVTPAYGRDYKNRSDAVADWNNGKDFILRDCTSRWDGQPCSIRDGLTNVMIRYSKNRKVTNV